MGLMERLLDALRGQLGRVPRQPARTYGEPGRVLTDRRLDSESAGFDIGSAFNASFPGSFDARLRSGFDPHRDYDGERARAADVMDAELGRTWKAGKPYSRWVADAARRAGI